MKTFSVNSFSLDKSIFLKAQAITAVKTHMSKVERRQAMIVLTRKWDHFHFHIFFHSLSYHSDHT